MFCRECGQSISEKDKFCENCGAKTSRGEAVQPSIVTPSASAPTTPASQQPLLTSSAIRFLPFIGLVAGILALVAVFTSWTGMRAPYAGVSAEATAWDMVINAKIMGEEYGREAFAFIALSGSIIILLASLLALATTKAKSPWGILGMIVGGLLSTASAIWALSDIDTGTMQGMTVTYGFGLYLALAGGIVASVAGAIGLLFDESKRNALTDILKRSLGNRLVAAIALIGCILAVVGVFTPWVFWNASSHRTGSNSAWDYIVQAEGARGLQLRPSVYHWFVLVGALLAVLGVLFALAVPRLRLALVTTVLGGMLALAGVIWYLTERNFTPAFHAYGYGAFLTLAGSIVAVVGALIGLAMMTDILKWRFHSPMDYEAVGTERGSETVAAHLEAEREKYCPSCGVRLPENVKFCLECGANMLDHAPKSVASTRKARLCDNCGCAVSVNHRVCIYCGADVKLTPDAPKSDTWNWRESKFYHWLRDVWGT